MDEFKKLELKSQVFDSLKKRIDDFENEIQSFKNKNVNHIGEKCSMHKMWQSIQRNKWIIETGQNKPYSSWL